MILSTTWYRVDYEIGISKQCLIGNGINDVTSFAYPFAEGSLIHAIINTVAKYYPLARTANIPFMFLDCNGWNNDNDDGTKTILVLLLIQELYKLTAGNTQMMDVSI